MGAQAALYFAALHEDEVRAATYDLVVPGETAITEGPGESTSNDNAISQSPASP